MKSDVYFVSRNKFKYEEINELFIKNDLEINYFELAIEELQSDDIKKIILNKTLDAYNKIKRPVIVEHTGLYIKSLNNFPGGLTQLFWDKLQGDKICKMVDSLPDRTAFARTIIGFCDGKNIFTEFEGELEGSISSYPKGGREFQWGTIFLPKNYEDTYSLIEIDELNTFSHRFKAFKKFIDFYKENYAV